MSVHKFTWLWILSKWFLTSPDNIKRQQTIWGLTAQAADRRQFGQQQAGHDLTFPFWSFCRSAISSANRRGVQDIDESVSDTSENCGGQDKGHSAELSLMLWYKTAESQPHWFYSKQHKYVTDRLQVQHWWKALPAVSELFITVWSIDHFINALPGTHAVHNYKAVDQSYTINRLWLQQEHNHLSKAPFSHTLPPWNYLDVTQRSCMGQCKYPHQLARTLTGLARTMSAL